MVAWNLIHIYVFTHLSTNEANFICSSWYFPMAFRNSKVIFWMSVLFLAKWPNTGKDKGMLGADDIHWDRRHNLPTVIFKLFRGFKTTSNIPYALVACKKQSGQQDRNPKISLWPPVVTSTLREFRDEMVRSQLIIVTNSTQMQERLLTEPATCPYRHSLLSAHRLGEDSCADTLGQGQRWPSQTKQEPSSAWWHLHPPVQDKLVPCPVVTKVTIILYDDQKESNKN